MARMSIDDMLGRDPRLTVLAEILGWSKREAAGCLILEVWPICYDQCTDLISERLIDAAACKPGFARAMVESEFATVDRSGKIRVRGAKDRIRYLEQKREAGRQGGLKSAEGRANDSKQTSSTEPSEPQASGNPPVPDPVLVTPYVLPAPPQSDSAKPEKPKRRKCRLPADWQPRPEERQSAVARGLDCGAEVEAFRDHHNAKGEPLLDWDAAFRTWLRNAVKFNRPRQGSLLGPVDQPRRIREVK